VIWDWNKTNGGKAVEDAIESEETSDTETLSDRVLIIVVMKLKPL